MRIYLAGPMAGIEDFNFPAFFYAAKRIGDLGHIVVNPAELDLQATPGPINIGGWQLGPEQRRSFLKRDVRELTMCDAVAVLPGWEASSGARLEVSTAESLDIPILNAETLKPYYEYPATEAIRIVHGRERGYPHPTKDFNKIGKIWSGVIAEKLTAEITPEEVALMMAGLKIARESSHHKRDNIVDVIGYMETLEMILRNGEAE